MGSVGLIGPGLDIRADGNYVVAPPSVHANGKSYSFDDPHAATERAPSWLLASVKKSTDKEPWRMTSNWKRSTAETAGYEAQLGEEVIREGQRNKRLFEMGVAFVGSTVRPMTRLGGLLLLYNKYKTEPPLSDVEVTRDREAGGAI